MRKLDVIDTFPNLSKHARVAFSKRISTPGSNIFQHRVQQIHRRKVVEEEDEAVKEKRRNGDLIFSRLCKSIF